MADTTQADFLKQLAAALAAVGGGIGGRAIANSQGNPLTSAVPPQLSQLLDMSNQRYAYQNPLFQATTQGAYAMLPDFAKTGTSLSGSLPSSVPAAPASGSGGGPGIGTALGIGGASALIAGLAKAASGGGGDLQKIFDAIKKKFGGQQPNIQGNKPNAGGALPSGNPGMNRFTGWNDGSQPNLSPGSQEPTPSVTTDWQVNPNDMWNLYNGDWTGPSAPSGGNVGPGMQDYYDSGGGSDGGGDTGSGLGPEPGPGWGG